MTMTQQLGQDLTHEVPSHTSKQEETSSVSRSNLPPGKKKSEVLVLKHYRLRDVDVRQTVAVVDQRGTDINDVVRKQFERGVSVDSALGAPGEDGRYGLYDGARLAELLRQDIDGLIGFALKHGVVPTVIQEYRTIIRGLNETIGGMRGHLASLPQTPTSPVFGQVHQLSGAVTERSDEADSVLGLFFGGPGHDEK
jgi:hypothetical protein